MQFHHTSLSVSNLETSLIFYTTMLGFKEIKRFERPDLGGKATLLELGGYHLELWQFDATKPNKDDFSDLHTRGIKHLAFRVENVEHVYHTLTAQGITATEPKQGSMAKYIFIKDPDGFPIEILEMLN
ncbi:MAG: VOC family protein [Patescibacteria group bacterium]|nr:VOC family protein [Patescibacteria group bacterium]